MIDAEAAALRAVEVAAREIERLARQSEGKGLSGFDAMDLEKYSKICLSYDHHKLTWMAKLEPEKLPDELLRRWTKAMGEDERPPRARRS